VPGVSDAEKKQQVLLEFLKAGRTGGGHREDSSDELRAIKTGGGHGDSCDELRAGKTGGGHGEDCCNELSKSKDGETESLGR